MELLAVCQHIGGERYPDRAAGIARRVDKRRRLVGLRNLAELRHVVGALKRPFNVVTGWLDPDITAAQLAEAGAKRISLGGALSRLAFAAVIDAGRAMQAEGSFAWMREMAPTGELRRMFAGR
jgi:2-methylisocitrate lyase-like PEP mutase family enzyme